MAFCSGCGADVPAGSAFCKQCGRPVAAGSSSPSAPPAQHSNPGSGAPATAGLAENVAGALCYLLGWVTGLIFLLIDKRPSVRFHAAQSIVIFGVFQILFIIIAEAFSSYIVLGRAGFGWSFGYAFYNLIWLVGLILGIFLMFKAYQGEQFRVPVAADFADKLVGKTPA
jgi:uncharacterized membrane protein